VKLLGKLVGGVLGWLLLRHPAGLVIGLLLGHAFDAGWLRRSSKPSSSRAATLTPADACRVLGVEPDADNAHIDAAYRRLITQYHPDKVAGAAQEIRELAEKRATELNAAYDILMRARKRDGRP